MPDAYLYENETMLFKFKQPRPDLVSLGFNETKLYYDRQTAYLDYQLPLF